MWSYELGVVDPSTITRVKNAVKQHFLDCLDLLIVFTQGQKNR